MTNTMHSSADRGCCCDDPKCGCACGCSGSGPCCGNCSGCSGSCCDD